MQTSASVKLTFLTSIITTPASISATQQGKGNASTTTSKAAPSATAVAEGFSPSRSNASDKTTINIAVGVGGKYRHIHLNPGRTQNNNFLAITLLLLVLLIFIFRKPIKFFFKKRKTSRSDATRSIWRGESMVTTAPAPAAPRQKSITRDLKQQLALVQPLKLNPDNTGERIVSVNTVMRQERLGLVRDLPPSRDLDIEVTREVEQTTMNRYITDIARRSDTLDEKGRSEALASPCPWENVEIAAKRKSLALSETSVHRWRTPVSWVRDQRRRGWGRLSG
jgi:hypothetical protein